ncbi:Aspercryptin biosynthesis cluster protein B [Colletotrichum shisoi]|uniref:Aspercryptin biosynthesis cluster protein B n=1 Tax=Colletotrichum shisoi TaxID=2078593 RepID=A0A5Q4C2Z5_9PEZI|nr:Aspercryptin biosynthesis cluster protein B [Colletotrichum shisoi]
MATTSTKSEWLVIIPDKPGSLATRFAVRSYGLSNLCVEPFRVSGVWKMGGPMLHELPANEEPSSLKVIGSTIVCVAESKEEIMEMLKRDVYVDRGVWDLERVQMWPVSLVTAIL